MSREINLLKSSKKISTSLGKFQKLSFTSIPVLISIYVIILLVVFGLSWYLNEEIEYEKKNQEQIKTQLSQYSDTEVQIRRLKKKVNQIIAILDNRTLYSNYLDLFVKRLGNTGISIDSINMTSDGSTKISVISPDSQIIASFESELKKLSKEKGLYDIELSSANYRTNSASYELNVSFLFSKEIGNE